MAEGGAAASQTGFPDGVKVKKEYDGYSMGQRHTLSIQFKGAQKKKNKFDCAEYKTVLEAIKSRDTYKELGWSEDKIMIQWGKEDRENIISTHFPCSCLKDDDILIVSETSETVEERRAEREILPKDEYSVFYIDTVGGKNTKSKPVFKNKEVRQFKFLSVYGEKDISVQEALERDGRFVELPNFTLIDNSDPDTVIQSDDKINVLHGKKFKIELQRGSWPGSPKKTKDPEASSTKQAGKRRSVSARGQKTGGRDSSPGASGDFSQKGESKQLQGLVQRSGFRTEDVDLMEVMEKLREQFPDLKKLMESRFPGNSYQEALKLKKENFGKIQQDFSEVRTLEKLLEMGKSVCHVNVEGFCSGTGFVLIDNFIMTNAHLFEKCTDGNTLRQGTKVYVVFNYENPPPNTYYNYFKVEESYICYINDELDYAVLKVQPEGQTHGSPPKRNNLEEPPVVPKGLLKNFWEMPEDGGVCIIGHPRGEVKQIDLTCVIEPENREQTADENYQQLILYPVNEGYKRGIDQIKKGGSREKEVMTYNTFMYHGASGSPVFDAQGRVCGLHTGGYRYEFKTFEGSLIEYGQSLEIIMKHLVETLTKGNDQELLGKIWKVSGENTFLSKVLKPESVRGGESNKAQQSDSVESMEISSDEETGVRTNQAAQ